MYDIVIVKTPDDMYDCVAFADVCKELVSKSLAFGCALDKTCDVDKFNDRRGNFLCVIKLSELFDPVIRDSDNPTFGRPTIPNFIFLCTSPFIEIMYRFSVPMLEMLCTSHRGRSEA